MTEEEILDKVSSFFEEMDDDLNPIENAKFLTAMSTAIAAFVSRHYQDRAFDDIGRTFGEKIAEKAKKIQRMERSAELHIVIVTKEK